MKIRCTRYCKNPKWKFKQKEGSCLNYGKNSFCKLLDVFHCETQGQEEIEIEQPSVPFHLCKLKYQWKAYFWKTHGDHDQIEPLVKKNFKCKRCNNKSEDHGIFEPLNKIICPNTWIVEDCQYLSSCITSGINGTYLFLTDFEFKEMFELIIDQEHKVFIFEE
jgi:hypothetical protein